MRLDNVKSHLYLDTATSNKTSLFSEALKLAEHGNVLYISKEEIQEIPSDLKDWASLNKHYLKRISLFYLKTLNSLINELSNVHEWQNVPKTIILDNLEDYCDLTISVQKAAGLIASLQNAVSSCSSKLDEDCNLLVSVNKSGQFLKPSLRVLVDLYFHNNVCYWDSSTYFSSSSCSRSLLT